MKKKKKSDLKSLLERDDYNGFVWLHFSEITSKDIEFFKPYILLHPLTIEDLILEAKRPKVEEYSDYLLVSMFALEMQDELHENEIDFIVGKKFLISSYSKPEIDLESYIEKRYDKKTDSLTKGPSFLLYYLIDRVVDQYYPVIEDLNDEIEDLEDEMFNEPKKEHSQTIFMLKKYVLALRRKILPQKDVINALMTKEKSFMHKETAVYLRDVYDHVVNLKDMIDSSRFILSESLDIYLSSLSNKMNEVMKTLAVIATIVLPMTLISSIYGMNFVPEMPPFADPNGFIYVWIVMLLIPVSLILYFKLKKWF